MSEQTHATEKVAFLCNLEIWIPSQVRGEGGGTAW